MSKNGWMRRGVGEVQAAARDQVAVALELDFAAIDLGAAEQQRPIEVPRSCRSALATMRAWSLSMRSVDGAIRSDVVAQFDGRAATCPSTAGSGARRRSGR